MSPLVLRLPRSREGMFWTVQRRSGAQTLTVIVTATMGRMTIAMRFQVRPEEDESVVRKDGVKAHQPSQQVCRCSPRYRFQRGGVNRGGARAIWSV